MRHIPFHKIDIGKAKERHSALLIDAKGPTTVPPYHALAFAEEQRLLKAEHSLKFVQTFPLDPAVT
jgi:hypothetical protein